MQTYTLPMEELAKLISLQLQEGGRATLTVTGSSMLPMLRDGKDTVELIPVSGHQKKGDIILYRRENGSFILHRIIRTDSGQYVCCGDNQYTRETVAHTQLLAVVDGFTYKGRKIPLTNPGYRLYTAVWVGLFPLRRAYIFVRRRLGALRRKLLRKH